MKNQRYKPYDAVNHFSILEKKDKKERLMSGKREQIAKGEKSLNLGQRWTEYNRVKNENEVRLLPINNNDRNCQID